MNKITPLFGECWEKTIAKLAQQNTSAVYFTNFAFKPGSVMTSQAPILGCQSIMQGCSDLSVQSLVANAWGKLFCWRDTSTPSNGYNEVCFILARKRCKYKKEWIVAEYTFCRTQCSLFAKCTLLPLSMISVLPAEGEEIHIHVLMFCFFHPFFLKMFQGLYFSPVAIVKRE